MLKLFRFIIFVVLIFFLLVLGRNIILKFAVEKGVEAATGLQLQIEKFDLGIAETHLGINNLQLLNPSGYPDRVMFEAPEVFVDYNLGSILKGKIHLEEIRLNFDKFVVVRPGPLV